jgi:hypothetical protein
VPGEIKEGGIASGSANADREATNASQKGEPHPSDKENVEINRKLFIVNTQQLYASSALNLVLAISTVVLAVFTWQLSEETKVLKTSAQDQTRPYVLLTNISQTSNENESFITVKNLGITPAYNVEVNGEAYILPLVNGRADITPTWNTDCLPTSNPQLKKYGEDHPGGSFNLGANAERTTYLVNSDTPTNSPLWQPTPIDHFPDKSTLDVKNGKSAIVAIGIVCYKNAHSQLFYTRYCKVFFNAQKVVPNWSSLSDTAKEYAREGDDCPLHNDAD